MNKFNYFLLFILFGVYTPSFSQKKEKNESNNIKVKVMTFNIRYANPNDGDNIWGNREKLVYNVFKKYKCDFVGSQEVLPQQLLDLKGNLPLYCYISRSRDKNPDKGEACPLFYITKKWKLIDSQTFWLSETPAITGSKSWESSLPRICTWGLFENKKTGFKLRVYNTHFDHRSQKAREESIKLIIRMIEDHKKDSLPFILMGDLNVEPDNMVIKKLNSLYTDSYKKNNQRSEPDYTFQGWDIKNKKRIDYIYTSKKIEVKKSIVIRFNRNGQYPSDHLPVYSKIKFIN
ncbi:MAG: endonuclease/exonuclease/phosphatase family protein [Bacteroidota bacterium]